MNILNTLVLMLACAVAAPVLAEDPAPAKVVDRSSPDFVRCKKEVEIGSLVKKNKICRTNAEWKALGERESSEAMEHLIESLGSEAKKFVEDNTTRPAGN